ncbi:CPBP family intramembrane metalloprotease [Pseudomonas sp. R2.Fl]|nr:CPBP family intramembrane metalloprotease [Pseudomonas sp. R2.Fl]
MRRIGKFWTALLVLPAWMAVTVLVGLLTPREAASQTVLISEGIAEGIVAASVFLLIALSLLRWDRLGFQAPEPPRSALLTWMPALYIAVLLAGAALLGLPPAGTMAVILVNCLFVGFSEEVMFRGILFRGALSRMRVVPAAIFTSILFGLVHTLNAFATGQPAVAMAQAVAAFMSGVLYNAIRIRTQSIYPMMIVHALWDFALFMIVHAAGAVDETVELTPSNLLLPALMILPLFTYGLFLLRGMERDFGWMSEAAPRETVQPAA